MVTWKYLGIGGQDIGMREEALNQKKNRTNWWILGDLIHNPRIIGSISRLNDFRSPKIVDQNIRPSLYVLQIHIDTVVASCH